MKTTATETTFETGAIEGNAYANKFFGVEYALPEGFSFYSADQLAEMSATIGKTNNDEEVVEAFKGGKAFFDMAAAADDDPNVSIVIQIAGPDPEAAAMDEAGYIETAKDKILAQLTDAGATVKGAEPGTYANQKTGDEFTAMKLAIELQGTPLCEEVISIKAGDYFMNITATATGEAELDSVLSHLTRIR